MTHDRIITDIITEKISARLNTGFAPDKDSLYFLSTSYGVNSERELVDFLHDSFLNDGTIYELIVYPDEKFLSDIEKIIPSSGLLRSEIEFINSSLHNKINTLFINIPSEKYFIDTEICPIVISSFIKKLSLDIDVQYLGDPKDSSSEEIYYMTRALLRRKKFLPLGDRGHFMKKIIRYETGIKPGDDILLNLIEKGIDLLSDTNKKTFDILSAKKYFYESVISQIEEFNTLVKTWGMEFLMMKRIQPPPVSIEEAIDAIRTIDRLTTIAYGLIIPPSDIAVQISIDSLISPSDIFS